MKRALLWGPAFAYMALIYVASSVPGSELPGHFWDKAVHFLVYAGLGVLFLIPLAEGRLSKATAAAAMVAVLLAIAHGVFDELHQMFTPNRTPDVRDIVADALGASMGVAAILVMRLAAKKLGLFEREENGR